MGKNISSLHRLQSNLLDAVKWNGFYENMTIQDTAEHLRLLYPEYVEKTLKSFPDTEYLKENPNNDIYHQYHAEFLSKNHSSWN